MNHIIEMDAKWKSHRTCDLIDFLDEITLLHFKDRRRPMYGDGNYRLKDDFKRYLIKINLSDEEKEPKLHGHLTNVKNARYCQFKESDLKIASVKSTYYNFTAFHQHFRLAKKWTEDQRNARNPKGTKGKRSR